MIRTPLKRATTIKPSGRRMKSGRPKMTPARSNAKGQPCTLNLPGCYPGPDNEQVQLCHLRMFNGGGTGLKPHDSEGVFGCTSCHDLIDGRTPAHDQIRPLFWEHIAWAIIKTLRIQREAGVLTYRGEA